MSSVQKAYMAEKYEHKAANQLEMIIQVSSKK